MCSRGTISKLLLYVRELNEIFFDDYILLCTDLEVLFFIIFFLLYKVSMKEGITENEMDL